MPSNYKLGMEAKLYYGAAAALLSALTEADNVKDLTLNLEGGEADITTRGNAGWRATAPTLKEATVEFEMIWLPTDTAFAAIRDAFLGNTTLRFAILDGDKDAEGTEGLMGDFAITNFSRNEALEEAITVSVTAKLSAFDSWVEVEFSSSSA